MSHLMLPFLPRHVTGALRLLMAMRLASETAQHHHSLLSTCLVPMLAHLAAQPEAQNLLHQLEIVV
jgi:hypothetical protein